MIFILPWSVVEAKYTIEAINCLSPSGVRRYQRTSLCAKKSKHPERRDYTVLQRRTMFKMNGYSCDLTYSEWIYRCGAWSHLKLARTPRILHRETVSPQWCSQLVSRRKFKPDNTADSIPIELGRTNVMTVTVAGSVQEMADKVICHGEDVHYQNSLHSNTVLLREYHLLIRTETFSSDGKRMEAMNSHETLPCSSSDRQCITGDKTFIWNPATEGCSLQTVKVINAQETRTSYLVDEDQSVIFNKTANTKIPGCDVELIKTQFEDVMLTPGRQDQRFKRISREEVRPDIEIRMAEEFNQYRREELRAEMLEARAKLACQDVEMSQGQTPVRLSGNQYAMSSGDIIYVFTCNTQLMEIKEVEKCYQDIPLVAKDRWFADMNTRLIKKHSAEVPCSQHFPPTIRTTDGFVELSDHQKRVKDPPEFHQEEEDRTKHRDRSNSGFYTEKELMQWERMISLPTYQKALLSELSWGTCVNQEECGANAEVQQYDLTRLMPEVIKEMNIWNKIKKTIHEYGDELAFLVIVMVIIKLLTDIVLISLALLREGPGAALALIINLYISNSVKYRKIRDRNRKMKKQEEKRKKRKSRDEEEEADGQEMESIHPVDSTV